MLKIKKLTNYFSENEMILWSFSAILIVISFYIFDGKNYLTLLASLIAFTFSYYGEMITYLGMTMPMAIFSLVSWLKNPYSKDKVEVKVNTITKKEMIFMCVAAIIVTLIFYFVLDRFNTANIVPSTISVTTSFLAAYLTFRRSQFFALAYASNDIVLIVLWILASMADTRYIAVMVCFIAFLINDIYGFVSWQKMKERQLI